MLRQSEAATARPSRNRLRTLAGCLLTAVLGAALVLGSLTGAPEAAQAAANPSDGFQPGNIISDANFYNADAMTTGDIQRFLNAKVPTCTIGQSGRQPGTPWGSTTIASHCLKNATFTTPTRASNAYCKSYAGARGESAAAIIRKVARACSISPRVLLIMLEKEQSLVSDTWPTVRQYDFAMGFDCPDSGPGNSANCSPGSGGFSSQVYRGAMQLQVYKANPNSYRYRPFQTNTIQWHPNVSCGTSQVYIENWATAALYIYTPYRPNAAALAAGWGTGDGCSAYGNRNFYNFYTSWFGLPTSGYAVDAKFQSLYASQQSKTGKPIALSRSISGGIMQQFELGRMYWNANTGASVVRGNILPRYIALGQMTSQLGAPIGIQRGVEGTHNQRFRNGEMFWTKATGALQVRGTTYTYFQKQGGAAKIGTPRNDQAGNTTRGVMQDFSKNVTLTWSASTTGKRVVGEIRKRFLKDGGVDAYGYALAGERAVSGGLRQRFSEAELYWNASAKKARSVSGEILKTMRAQGGYTKVGLPTSAEFSQSKNVIRQNFTNGYITWSKSGGGKFVSTKLSGRALAESPSTPDLDEGFSEPVESADPAQLEEIPTPTETPNPGADANAISDSAASGDEPGTSGGDGGADDASASVGANGVDVASEASDAGTEATSEVSRSLANSALRAPADAN